MRARIAGHAVLLLAVALYVASSVLPAQRAVQAQSTQPLLVIMSSASGITDISLSVLRHAFQGTPTSYAGKRLIPFNWPPHTLERTWFDRRVLGLEPDDVGRFWIARRIRDEGLPPRTLPSAELALRLAASFPGTIAYVRGPLAWPGVRALKIDGRAPGEPGYLFATP